MLNEGNEGPNWRHDTSLGSEIEVIHSWGFNHLGRHIHFISLSVHIRSYHLILFQIIIIDTFHMDPSICPITKRVWIRPLGWSQWTSPKKPQKNYPTKRPGLGKFWDFCSQKGMSLLWTRWTSSRYSSPKSFSSCTPWKNSRYWNLIHISCPLYPNKDFPWKAVSFLAGWKKHQTVHRLNFFLPRNSKKIDYVHRVDMLKMIRSATCPDQMKGDLFRTRQIKRKSPGQYA